MLAAQNFTIRTQKLADKARSTATNLTESGVLHQEARPPIVFGICLFSNLQETHLIRTAPDLSGIGGNIEKGL